MGRWPTPVMNDAGGTPVLTKFAKLDLTIDATNAAGVYTTTIDLPKNAFLLEVGAHSIALWNAGTSAALDAGDGTDPNGIFDAVNLKATELLAAEGIATTGNQLGAAGGVDVSATHFNRRWLDAARTLSFVITTVGTAPTTGSTLFYAKYVQVDEDGAGLASIADGTYVAT